MDCDVVFCVVIHRFTKQMLVADQDAGHGVDVMGYAIGQATVRIYLLRMLPAKSFD